MARQTRTIQTPLENPVTPVTALALDVPFTAVDIVNFEATPMSGPFMLVCWNSSGAGVTLTINSVPDSLRRTGDVTAYAIGAGLISILKFSSAAGWKQADGSLYYQGSAVGLKIAALALT